jgi:hypothetical protein
MTGSQRVARIRNMRMSASDDLTRIAAEQARARLDFERVERLAALQARLEKRHSGDYGGQESNYSRVHEQTREELVGEMYM